MRFDAHVHMHGGQANSDELLGRLKEAGFDGAVVFSPAPNGMLGESGTNEQRLEHLLKYTKGKDTLFPFYFIDPTEEDALWQLRNAKEAGAVGYKVICNHFYPGYERAMKVYHWIAENHMPLMFHSGILYDGINVSGKYNRPCEFEPLLSVEGLRFSMAHVSWPWTAECIAVYGKFNSFLERNPGGKAAKLYLDITPGTPPTFRQDTMTHVFGNGFHVEDEVFWGSDNFVEDYNTEYARRIRERDDEIFAKLGLSKELRNDIYYKNFMEFLKGK